MTFRLNYEPQKAGAGTPWGVEFPDGERKYFAMVSLRVPARTVLVRGPARLHGYLEAAGRLVVERETATIVEESDGEEQAGSGGGGGGAPEAEGSRGLPRGALRP